MTPRRIHQVPGMKLLISYNTRYQVRNSSHEAHRRNNPPDERGIKGTTEFSAHHYPISYVRTGVCVCVFFFHFPHRVINVSHSLPFFHHSGGTIYTASNEAVKARQVPGFKHWDRFCSTWGGVSARQGLGSQPPRARKEQSCSLSSLLSKQTTHESTNEYQ